MESDKTKKYKKMSGIFSRLFFIISMIVNLYILFFHDKYKDLFLLTTLILCFIFLIIDSTYLYSVEKKENKDSINKKEFKGAIFLNCLFLLVFFVALYINHKYYI